MAYILEKAENPSPYYDELPEGFVVPSVYFPQPEIDSSGDTLNAYAFNYAWFIKFFALDKPSVYALALLVLASIKRERNRIPLIDEDGNKTGRTFRVDDPSIRAIAESPAAYQLSLSWTSRRPFADVASQDYEVEGFELNIYTRDAFDAAVNQLEGGEV